MSETDTGNEEADLAKPATYSEGVALIASQLDAMNTAFGVDGLIVLRSKNKKQPYTYICTNHFSRVRNSKDFWKQVESMKDRD